LEGNINTKNVDSAKKVGAELAKRAMEKNIKDVVFDRSGYVFHGRIKAVADGAREAGLSF
jgi:large subunit ribosomal protein L18